MLARQRRRRLTAADQRLQDAARAHGAWLMWFVAASEGKARAWAIIADQHGGKRQPGELVANTPDELRAMLPVGLTRTDRSRSMVLGPDVLEVWD